MKSNVIQDLAIVDRMATADEIRAAVPAAPGRADERTVEKFHEFPSDTGGYVRISAEEFETAMMLGELTLGEK